MKMNSQLSHFYHTKSIGKGPTKFIDFFTSLNLKYFNVVIHWIIMYVLSIFSFNIILHILKIKNSFPVGLSEFLNSSWGGFLIVTLFLAIILNYIYSDNLYLNEILVTNVNTAYLTNLNFFLSVFVCQPPILHNKKEFSFFIKNFQPFSMEIHSDNQLIYIILFDSNKSFLELKKKECLDQLSSLFSNVSILSKLDLQKFLLNGLGIYHKLNPDDTFNDFESFKKLKFSLVKNNESIVQSNKANKHEYSLKNFSGNQFNNSKNVFLLMLLGEKGNNNISKIKEHHLFRGIRLGKSNNPIQEKNFLERRIKRKYIKEVLLNCLRIPEKCSESTIPSELERMYFFIIHKFFNYYFREIDTKEDQITNNQTKITVSISDSSKKNPEINDNNNSERLKISPSPKTKNKIITNTSESKHETTRFLSKKTNVIMDLKKIAFQFTYFCQYLCPIMNNEFKKKALDNKNDFLIPKNCLEHILLAKKDLDEFVVDENSTFHWESIFTENSVGERYFDFLREKELTLIDKICHFSSIIILTPNQSYLEDNKILDFIKHLDDNKILD